MKRFWWAVPILIIIAGVAVAQTGGKPPVKTSKATATPPIKYRFEPKTDFIQDPYQWSRPRSTYTLFETRPGSKEMELWRVHLEDVYSHHWISENGTVWVMNDPNAKSTPPTKGNFENLKTPTDGRIPAKIWARNRDGDILGEWNLGDIMRTGEKPLKSFNVDKKRSSAEYLGYRSHGYVEQLRLALSDGQMVTLTIAPTPTGDLKIKQLHPTGNPEKNLFVAHLRGQSEGEPKAIGEGLNGNPAFLAWPNHEGTKVLVMDQPESLTWRPGYLFDPKLWVADDMPKHFVKTPQRSYLWFEFPAFQPRKATLRVFSKGKMASVDLKELGEYQDSEQTQQGLDYKNLGVKIGGGWRPIDSVQNQYQPGPEQIEIMERDGRRFVITIDPDSEKLVSGEVFTGLDARKPTEPEYVNDKILREQYFTSLDGKFRVRTRMREFPESKVKGTAWQQGTMTLLMKASDGVKTKEIELFSRVFYTDPTSIYVSKTGRVYSFEPRAIPGDGGKIHKQAPLFVYEPDGKQVIGIDLVQQKLFTTMEQARVNVDLSKMVVLYEGPMEQRDVAGVKLPLWQSEKFTINTNDGKRKSFSIHTDPRMHMPVVRVDR